jgi:GNAT superfamily N-acetyltransferase
MNTEDPEILFRTATLQDIDDLRRFEQAIIAAERPLDPTLRAGRIHYYDIEAMLVRDDVQFVVAQRGNELVACGFARIEAGKAYESHAYQAYLGLMYVDPEFRGRSINSAIVERLKQWCRSKGVTELRLEVYSGNLAAIAAYEKTGFSKHMIEMRLR